MATEARGTRFQKILLPQNYRILIPTLHSRCPNFWPDAHSWDTARRPCPVSKTFVQPTREAAMKPLLSQGRSGRQGDPPPGFEWHSRRAAELPTGLAQSAAAWKGTGVLVDHSVKLTSRQSPPPLRAPRAAEPPRRPDAGTIVPPWTSLPVATIPARSAARATAPNCGTGLRTRFAAFSGVNKAHISVSRHR
jgi:hypothetical protein